MDKKNGGVNLGIFCIRDWNKEYFFIKRMSVVKKLNQGRCPSHAFVSHLTFLPFSLFFSIYRPDFRRGWWGQHVQGVPGGSQWAGVPEGAHGQGSLGRRMDRQPRGAHGQESCGAHGQGPGEHMGRGPTGGKGICILK